MTLVTSALVAWMPSNRLPLKTKYIWMGTRQKLAKLHLAASFPHVIFWVTVRDLRVTLGQELTFALHINHLCRDCYDQLRQLSIISRSPTSTATAILVHAFVSARLDYCSTLYAGLTGLRLGCLERVIRTAAGLVCGIPRTGHVSAYMLDVLHRLPLHIRLIFRLAILVFRCLLGLAPV